MRVIVVSPPEPIVSLDEAKRQLRVEHSDDDTLIQDLVAVATATIDGPGGWLGRALGEQVLELQMPSFWIRGWGDRLPYAPIRSIVSVAYLDAVGSEQIVDADSYRLSRDWIVPTAGTDWPAAGTYPDAVRIRYVAGWLVADGRWTGPAPIRHAILMMTTRLYAARGEDRPANLVEDPTINALLGPYRVWA